MILEIVEHEDMAEKQMRAIEPHVPALPFNNIWPDPLPQQHIPALNP